jgi:hypothetical protein
VIPFLVEARRLFDELATQYKLAFSEGNEWSVRYDGSGVFLEVHFDNGRSFELAVEIGRKLPSQPERPFSLAEILRLRSVPSADRIDRLSVPQPDSLVRGLQTLRELVRTHASDFLSGDDRSFAELSAQRDKETAAYAIERDLRAARRRAEAAWNQKDYRAVVDVLSPIRLHLTPAEVKCLEYSLRRTSS